MSNEKYPLPDFLIGICEPKVYKRWLQRKAQAHVRRDKHRGNKTATIEKYKQAINRAVNESEGKDYYTSEKLRWDLISQYDNLRSSEGKKRV